MKRKLISTGMTIALALTLAVPASMAVGKKKYSAAHNAAIKTCTQTYNAAVREARMKKGKEKSQALAAAKASRKQCVSEAPN